MQIEGQVYIPDNYYNIVEGYYDFNTVLNLMRSLLDTMLKSSNILYRPNRATVDEEVFFESADMIDFLIDMLEQ